MSRVVAKRELQVHGDVWVVPHVVNASRPALQAAVTGDPNMRAAVAELVAAPLDASGAQDMLSSPAIRIQTATAHDVIVRCEQLHGLKEQLT